MANTAEVSIPPQLADDAALERKTDDLQVTVAGKSVQVHVVQVIDRETDASKALNVLFLHSGKFSSQTWVDIQTLDHVANWGNRAIAIDLPGKGKSPEAIDREHYAEFLQALIAELSMTNVVIVSPSSSGRYTLPYLFKDAKTSTDRAVGFVPIAPGGTQDFTGHYPDSQLPTLIVYGTKDPEGPTTLNDLLLLPNHKVVPLENAGHACYLDQPDTFHRLLFSFLENLSF